MKGGKPLPRKPHLWFPGAKYHITSRGIRRSTLYYDEEDRHVYLSYLSEVKEKYPFILHSYCLMTNHLHLQLETLQTPPGTIMRELNGNYAKYFNKKYSFSGHVFENRYFREIIDSIGYELDVSKYIHLNPLKAGLVSKLENYPWSSYRTYARHEKNPLVTKDYVLSYIPHPQVENYERYLNSPFSFTESMATLMEKHDNTVAPPVVPNSGARYHRRVQKLPN